MIQHKEEGCPAQARRVGGLASLVPGARSMDDPVSRGNLRLYEVRPCTVLLTARRPMLLRCMVMQYRGAELYPPAYVGDNRRNDGG